MGCFLLFLFSFGTEEQFDCESAQEIKSKTLIPCRAAGPSSRFHSVTMKSGEVTTQHLSDCWHFHPALSRRRWPAVTAGLGPAEQGVLNVTAPSSPQR